MEVISYISQYWQGAKTFINTTEDLITKSSSGMKAWTLVKWNEVKWEPFLLTFHQLQYWEQHRWDILVTKRFSTKNSKRKNMFILELVIEGTSVATSSQCIKTASWSLSFPWKVFGYVGWLARTICQASFCWSSRTKLGFQPRVLQVATIKPQPRQLCGRHRDHCNTTEQSLLQNRIISYQLRRKQEKRYWW